MSKLYLAFHFTLVSTWNNMILEEIPSSSEEGRLRRSKLGRRRTIVLGGLFAASIASLVGTTISTFGTVLFLTNTPASSLDGTVIRKDYQLHHSSSNHSKKPFFVIHVGPPKTATSTIQAELTDLPHVLALDNYVYFGVFVGDNHTMRQLPVMKKVLDRNCHVQLEKVRMQFQTTSSNNDTASGLESHVNLYSQVPCWKDFLQAIQPYRGKSVIMVHETLSFELSKFRGIGLAPLDWIALQESLKDDWNVVVVIGYRRYYQWLPSAKQQHEHYRPTKPKLNQWPGRGGGGKWIQPLFPNFWKIPQHHFNQPYYFTDSVISMLQPHVPVVIFNMHQEEESMSLRSNFFCHVLPNASNACQYSLESDKNEMERIVNPFRPPRYYDMLVTHAESKGLLDGKVHRRRASELLAQQFHEHVWNLTLADFPTNCPDHHQLELFLNMSVALEASILPEFHAVAQVHHRAKFWESVEQGKYCSIDTEAVLQDENWKRFFASGMDIAELAAGKQ